MMKKLLIFLCCLMMLMTLPLSVCANDHVAAGNNGWPFYPNGNQHGSNHTDNSQHKTDGEHINGSDSGADNESCDSHGHNMGNVADLGGGQHEGVCSRCGQRITESHQYTAWNSDHSRECTVCHVVESGNHSMEESVLKQPTCKEDGTKKKY